MSDELEFEVWQRVQQTCDQSAFMRLVDEAVDGFKRQPGHDPIVRLHASGIGMTGIRVLRDVLKRHGFYAGPSAGYAELRSRLKRHLREHLQLHLMKGGLATEAMKEDHLCRDLGL
jgi:hypothetical protein